MSLITLTTDFGLGSPYVAAMKGVILSINPSATIVDLTHDVPAQDIRKAAIVLEDVARLFPDGTVHVAVIDPGVGTNRAIVFVEIGTQRYIAPDNGVLSRVAARIEPSQVVRIENEQYWREEVSSTFHGRDIMAPVAAHLTMGVDPKQLGPPMLGMTDYDWPEVDQSAERIEGMILEIDSFGNLITNITAEMLHGRPTDERVCVICNIFETWGVYNTYGDQPFGTLVALIGSGGRLELAVVGGSAANTLGVPVGTPVILGWE